MAESNSTARVWSNKSGAQSCTRKCTIVHQILPFERWARSIWPTKPVDVLRSLTRRSLRTCKYWIAGAREPSYADLTALLRSEAGFSLLQHLMGEAKPVWWRGVQKARSLSAMRKELDLQRRRIEQLELNLD